MNKSVLWCYGLVVLWFYGQNTIKPKHHIKPKIMGNFKNLRVWQKAKDAAIQIYHLTNELEFRKDYRFKDQMRAAAISVPSNIAEGDELDTNKQAVRHFYIAKGSTAEVITQLIIAKEIGYISEKDFLAINDEYEHISHMLAKLINARR